MFYIYKITSKEENKSFIDYFDLEVDDLILHVLDRINAGEESGIFGIIKSQEIENFTFETIYNNCETKEEAEKLTKFYIKKFNTVNLGYNK